MTASHTVHTRQTDRERGSTAVELAILTPVLLAVLGLMVAGGRLVTTHAEVDQAAAHAARAATLARSPTTAQTAGTRAAQQELAQQGLHCQPTEIHVAATRFAAPLGQAGQVQVSATCTVPLADLTVPGLPGSVRLPATFTSPTDPFRGHT